MTSDIALTYDIKDSRQFTTQEMLNLTFGLVNIWVITSRERERESPVNVALFIRPRGLVEK